MMGGAIPANRLKVKAAELVCGGAGTRVFAERTSTRRAGTMRDRDFIATSEFRRI
jgi:hypothetical protein